MKNRILPIILMICCVMGILLAFDGPSVHADELVPSNQQSGETVEKVDTVVPESQADTESQMTENDTTTELSSDNPEQSSKVNALKANQNQEINEIESQQDNVKQSETVPPIEPEDTMQDTDSMKAEDAQQPALRATTQSENSNQAHDTKRTILHTNDIHGRMVEEDGRVIGLPKLKTIKEQKQPDLMVDAGDAFQGLPLSNQSKGEEMAKAMNEIGYDAMAAGNHEFDFGYEQLKKLEGMLNFPILSSNVYKDGKLSFKPSVIIEKKGLKYGVIGVTTPETKTKTSPVGIKGVTFTDPLKSVTREMDKLNGQVDIFVILSHLGIDETTKEIWRGDYLTKQLSQNKNYQVPIFVIDGHSHSVLQNGETFGHDLLAQTGTALANIGQITFDYHDAHVENAKASLISAEDVKNVVPNAALQNQVEQANKQFLAETSEVIVPNHTIDLMGEREAVRTGETNLGNAIADAMEAYGQTGFSHPSDFAVTNSGGIRASIKKGEVTLNDIMTVLPFGNTIAQIQVKGNDVLKAFEQSLSAQVVETNGQKQLAASGGLLQISRSIRVYYDLDQEPGNRVREVQLFNHQTNQFEPLDLNRTYYVATNDFTASGGDGYDMFIGPREEGVSLDKVFADYLKVADLSQYDTTQPVRIINGVPESTSQNTSEGQPEIENIQTHPKVEQQQIGQASGFSNDSATQQTNTSHSVATISNSHLQALGNASETLNVASGKMMLWDKTITESKHHLQLTSVDETFSNEHSTAQKNNHARVDVLPETGTNEAIPLGLGLMMIGAGMVVVRFRRHHSQI
ncbi:5'-nucleotidase C-terminal domain-containing protein [Staphylococcus felis]|nr:5'-nucleotidase C-terminal domain-containing protein [Staphylococcus felis]